MDNAEYSIAQAPLPTSKTVRARTNLFIQGWRFIAINTRMLKMIFKGHHQYTFSTLVGRYLHIPPGVCYIKTSGTEQGESVAKIAKTHVLTDESQLDAIGNRLKRAHGQMGAVVRMLDEGRTCEEIVTQLAAVSKAINTAAFTLIAANLKQCIADDNQNGAIVTEKLQKLFLSLA